MIKVIVFDFDGVILDSVNIKTDAFFQLFRHYPQHVNAIMKYHLDNGGISRVQKFKYIYGNILKEPLSEHSLEDLCVKFADLVKNEVARAPFISGAREFLDQNFTDYRMYVVSGTPQEEMREIVKKRNLGRYFREVFGSPRAKAEILLEILKKNQCQPSEAVFIGDSINDFQAAKEAGVFFIAREQEVGADWLKAEGISAKIHDLIGLTQEILRLNTLTRR